MFTGIIEQTGTLVSLDDRGGVRRITVEAPGVAARLREGDSLAVSGVCLTALDPNPTYFHADLARKHGVSDAQIQAIWNKADPKFPDPVDQITYELVFAIYEKRDVSDDLHRRALDKLGHAGVSDIIGLTGLYSMIAQTIIFYRLSPPSE